MRITNTLFKLIENSLESNCDLIKNDSGALIYSDQDFTDKLILIKEGTIRSIDETNVFASLTLEKIKSPCIFGVSKEFGRIFNEIIRASSSCSYYLVDSNSLDLSVKFEIERFQRTNIDTFEVTYLFSLFKSKQIIKKNNKYDFESFKDKLAIYSDRTFEIFSDIYIYADKEKKGFVYGQQVTIETLKKYFYNTDIPRIITYNYKNIFSGSTPQYSNNNRSISVEPDLNFDEVDNKEANKNIVIKDKTSINNNKRINNKINNEFQYLNGFKPIRANGQAGSFEAILCMIIDFYKLPTRRDTLKKASLIIEKEKEQKESQLLIILDNFGINSRVIRFDPDKPFNITCPSLWIDEQGFCKLFITNKNGKLNIFDPASGLSRLDPKGLTQLIGKQNRIISFNLGLHAPKKRFTISWILPYLSSYKNQLIEVFSASFLNQVFALATPLLFQQIIDRVISKGAGDALTPLIILMFIFVIMEISFSSLRTFQFVEVTNRIDINLGSTILSRLLRLNAKFFDSKAVGELSSRLNELENIRKFLTGTALTVLLDAIFSVLYIIVLLFYSPLLTGVLLLSIPLLLITTIGVTPITQSLIRRRAEAQAKTQSYLVEMLNGIQTLKLQNSELTARKEWEDRHLNTINASFKAIVANTASSNASQLINKITNIALIGVGTGLVLQNKLTLGELIAFRIISGNITQPLLRLASSWQSFQELTLSLQRVGEIVNQPLEVLENEENNIEIEAIKGDIVFEDITYSYSSYIKPVLNSVSLKLDKGSFIALIGQSGCGKSTLLKMIPRLYLPTSGRILIDGLDISKVELYSLRSQIGFVPQDCMLFEGTVFTNIAIGNPKVDANSVIKVARAACAHDFIMKLPFGYGTPIGEKGSGLSGGQRQRIALARMLLENPNMIILDEATSALDVDTEKQVLSNLTNVFKDKTKLVITHRLSSVVDADKIIVMDSGRVDSIGSHNELMNLKGRYYAMYKSQYNE